MTLADLPETMRMVRENTTPETIGGHRVGPGYLIADDRWETLTHVGRDNLAGLTVTALGDLTAQGKDVDHVTRVTGYFSKVSAWNKGKTRELKDRHRGGI